MEKKRKGSKYEQSVNFIDPVSTEHMENFNVDNSALYRKLQSKIEALNIIKHELEQSRTERDQWKLMAETLQLRYSAIKSSLGENEANGVDYSGGSSVRALLTETQQKNIKLQTETDTLRQRLAELEGDIRLLRRKNHALISANKSNETKEQAQDEQQMVWNQERSNFIAQLEALKKQNAQLKYDFKSLLDEKEEIVTERDAYKCKAHRLNYELNVALKNEGPESKILDIDALILENKLLQERLNNTENELDMAKTTVDKYKGMVETKRKKGIMKFSINSTDINSQVRHLLDKTHREGSGLDKEKRQESIAELKQLCLTLLDDLNDKSLALSHQKKANKLLAAKIADLDQRIRGTTSNDTTMSLLSPSLILLNGYSSANVDTENDKQIFQKYNDDPITLSPAASSSFIRSETSESTKSMGSNQECDKFSATSDVSSEYTTDTVNEREADLDGQRMTQEERGEGKLEELPKEIKDMVQRALDAMNLEEQSNHG